jgi:hypothetical protein
MSPICLLIAATESEVSPQHLGGSGIRCMSREKSVHDLYSLRFNSSGHAEVERSPNDLSDVIPVHQCREAAPPIYRRPYLAPKQGICIGRANSF